MTQLSGDEYMALLQRRQQEWLDAHATEVAPRFPPLLEWFIRDGDEDLVDPAILNPPPVQAAPKRAKPRAYRSAESLRQERDRVQAQLDAIHNRDGGDRGDRAAANLSTRSRSRSARSAGRRRFEQMDRDLERHGKLTVRLKHLDQRIAAAEAREARAEVTAGRRPSTD